MRALMLALLVALLALLPAFAQDLAWEARGEEVYTAQCAACHQPTGEGLPPTFPALAGNEFVLGEVHPVIATVLFGRGAMPAFGHLPDEDIAAVVSYIRNSWNNEAEPVDPQAVAQVREDPEPEAPEEPEVPEVELPEGWQAEGEALFTANCAACHQASGEGVAGVFPPLAQNPFVTGEGAGVAQEVIRIVLHGRGGMPSFSGLSDEQLAFILSYVRTSWENEASLISPEMVAQVRAGVDLEEDEVEEKEPVDDPDEDEEDTPGRPGAAD